jgi:hypothetical protein
MNDLVINKIQSIQRGIARAREEYNADPAGFATNHTIRSYTTPTTVPNP